MRTNYRLNNQKASEPCLNFNTSNVGYSETYKEDSHITPNLKYQANVPVSMWWVGVHISPRPFQSLCKIQTLALAKIRVETPSPNELETILPEGR